MVQDEGISSGDEAESGNAGIWEVSAEGTGGSGAGDGLVERWRGESRRRIASHERTAVSLGHLLVIRDNQRGAQRIS